MFINEKVVMSNILIYGVNGYSGQLVVEEVLKLGLKPVLAGRNKKKVAALTEKYALEYKAFSLLDADDLVRELTGFNIVMHCAGPYVDTFAPMVDACIKVGADYLDLSGEMMVFEEAAARSSEFKTAGIMVMPGVAFDIVPSDSLAVYLKNKLPDATELGLYFNLFHNDIKCIGRGSNTTFIRYIGKGNLVRINGEIVSKTAGFDGGRFDIDGKKIRMVGLPWGDVSTAYHSTGIGNIKTFMDLPELSILTMKMSNIFPSFWQSSPVQKLLAKVVTLLPESPDKEARSKKSCSILGEVRNEAGDTVRAILETTEVYNFTGISAAAILKAVANGRREPGHQTPGRLLGPDFVLDIAGTKRRDLD